MGLTGTGGLLAGPGIMVGEGGGSSGTLERIPFLGLPMMLLKAIFGDLMAGRWMTGMDLHRPLFLSVAATGRGREWLWETSALRGRALSDYPCRA